MLHDAIQDFVFSEPIVIHRISIGFEAILDYCLPDPWAGSFLPHNSTILSVRVAYPKQKYMYNNGYMKYVDILAENFMGYQYFGQLRDSLCQRKYKSGATFLPLPLPTSAHRGF